MIDRTLFDKSELVQAVKLPAKHIGSILKQKKSLEFIWTSPGRKSVYPCPDDPKDTRILLLRSEFPQELQEEFGAQETKYQVKWGYDDLNAEQALKMLLPNVLDPPTSFETIGHIAHMNLRDEYLPYKDIIGQVIIDKNAHIDVVVTKVGTLTGEFRTFDMEIIGSRNDSKSLVATV
jgi:tRNA (guanine37-N1)-methyltransferase